MDPKDPLVHKGTLVARVIQDLLQQSKGPMDTLDLLAIQDLLVIQDLRDTRAAKVTPVARVIRDLLVIQDLRDTPVAKVTPVARVIRDLLGMLVARVIRDPKDTLVARVIRDPKDTLVARVIRDPKDTPVARVILVHKGILVHKDTLDQWVQHLNQCSIQLRVLILLVAYTFLAI